jgi:hypothetical protein
MRDYVIEFPSEQIQRITEAKLTAVGLLFGEDSEKALPALQKLYTEIRKMENGLPKGKRFHKGDILYWWGFALILQEDKQQVSVVTKN